MKLASFPRIFRSGDFRIRINWCFYLL